MGVKDLWVVVDNLSEQFVNRRTLLHYSLSHVQYAIFHQPPKPPYLIFSTVGRRPPASKYHNSWPRRLWRVERGSRSEPRGVGCNATEHAKLVYQPAGRVGLLVRDGNVDVA